MTTEHNEIVENEESIGDAKTEGHSIAEVGLENAPNNSGMAADKDGHGHDNSHNHEHDRHHDHDRNSHDHHHQHGHDHSHTHHGNHHLHHDHGQVEAFDPKLSVSFTVEVRKEKIAAAFEEKINAYAFEVKLPGFRKGKAPMEVVKARFKDALMDEVSGLLLQNAVIEKLQHDKIKAISKPQVMKMDHPEGQDMKAEITVETLPVFEAPDLEAIEVEVPAEILEMEPFNEEKAIERIRQNNQRQVPVAERPVEDGDMIMIEYQSKIIDTKRLSPKKSSYYYARKDGSHEIIDLYNDMLNKKTGDQFIVERTYPEDFKKKPWAGKKIEHAIHVKTIYEMKLPELDEAFLTHLGYQNEEDFRAKLRADYEEYKSQNHSRKTLDIILDKLVDTVQFPIPQSLLRQEVAHMIQQNPYVFNPSQDREAFQSIYLSLQTKAEKNIRFSLISDAIAEKYQVKVVMDDFEAEYKKIAEVNSLDVKEVRKYYMKKEHQQYLEDTLQRTKILDLIKEKVQIKEV